MAAYGALVSLMHLIHDLERRPSPPISLDHLPLDSITQHITYFQYFLHSYNIPPPPPAADDNKQVGDPFEMRIADAAYAAEDAIENHIVESINHKKKYKKANDDDDNNINTPISHDRDDLTIKSINRCNGILQSVIEEMNSIKNVVVNVQRKQKAVLVHDQASTSSVVARSEEELFEESMVHERRSLIAETQFRGVELEVMEKLAGGDLNRQVITIVGMGGIGKTFLAKSIYTKPLIKERFDKFAWATVSQHNDTGENLCELLSQATNTKKEKLSGKSVEDLGLELFKYLFCRRFLIVMDDMWSINSWDRIQRFFPDNGNGSRVLVTTRISQLSRQLNNDYRLQMSFLDKASSWNLFSTKVFGEKSCPRELEEIGEKIVDNCRGLPLAIVLMAGLLKNMDDTRASWESVQDNITSLVNMEGDKHCFRLLKLSYDHLPVYLKPCFLYMGVFEKGEDIRVSALVPQWVSEGFLKPTMGETLETTARGFLQELIDRNLILIGELGCTGSIKSCKIHDLMRDLCLYEGHKVGFYHSLGNYIHFPKGMNAHRRVIIPKYTSIENVRGDLRLMSHTRSIICEYGKVALCRNLVLLRKLQAHKKSSLSNNEIHLNSLVFRYLNLRHIAIKSPMMSKLPSVSRLWNLHTLIVSFSFLYEPIFVADFWKIPRFRHFEIVYGYARLPDPPNGNEREGVMENLHTLKGVRNFKCSEEVVRRIPNIKRLKLEYNGYDGDNVVDDDHDEYFVGNMNNLGGLEFLSVSFLPVGRISPMQNITFPNSLKKLSLCMEFEFEWDSMLKKIALLPLLEKLKLCLGSFQNGVWVIVEEEFPSLKYLELYKCQGLKRWTLLEESSYILPRLEQFNLDGLEDLQEIPLELGGINTLQSIKFSNCGEGLVRSLKAMFDEQVELQGGEDQISFYVQVNVRENQQHLLSLVGPKFYVKML